MGETVTFPSNGSTASGYLAVPGGGSGPGVLVLQEWWGVVPQLTRVCDRLAGEGFVALAPDLYHGEVVEYTEGAGATHTEMDKAGQLMNALPPDRAGRDMKAAVDYLLGHEAVRGDRVGVLGFCMGGALSMIVGAMQGESIAGIVTVCGAPLGEMEPDWSRLSAAIQGHFAEDDAFFTPEAVRQMEEKLRSQGKELEFHFYPGTGHAFTNDTNPLGTYDEEASKQVWARAFPFLHGRLE